MTTDDALADTTRADDGWVVRFRRRLPHDRAKVWRAITESEHLRQWMPCDIVGERRAGGAIELPFWPEHVEKYGIEEVMTGEIRVWDPPSRFEWTWDSDVLRWELDEGDEGDTVLTFTTWIAPDDDQAVGVAAGYHLCLDSLEGLLDDGAPAVHIIDADTTPMERRYRAAMLGGPS